METSTPKKAPRCKQCGGPTKGHAALGSKPGPKNCSNPPWAEDDDAGAIGNVVGFIRAQADAAAKEQEPAEPGTTGDAGLVEEEAPSSGRGTFVMLKPPLHKALTKLQPRKSVFSETDDEGLSEEAQANSFEMPSFEVGQRDVARERVESSSDAMVDVRTHVAGKVFVVCLCVKDRDCECPGEVKFGPDPSALTAVVAAVAMFEDPVTEEDWRPALALARDGWTADRPNTLALVPSIAAKGVAIKGKVVVEALRVVKVVKGRKVVDTKITLKMDGVEIKQKGFKSPLVAEYLEAPLYQLDESADEASIAEDEASIAEEEDLEDDERLKTKDDDMTEGENESCGEELKSASENEDDEEESYEEIEDKDNAEEDIEDTEDEENVDKDDAEETKEEEGDEETEEDTADEAEEDERPDPNNDSVPPPARRPKKTISFSELDEYIKSKMQKSPAGDWQCLFCGKLSKVKTNILEHIEAAHVESPGYDCEICQKHCRTRNALRAHKHHGPCCTPPEEEDTGDEAEEDENESEEMEGSSDEE